MDNVIDNDTQVPVADIAATGKGLEEQFADVAESLRPVAEMASRALTDFAAAMQPLMETFREALNTALGAPELRDLMVWSMFLDDDEDYEQAYYAYANKLNWTRPRRKVSWKRLNYKQRFEALRQWLGVKPC